MSRSYKSIAKGLREAIELNQGGKVAAHNHSVEISMPKQKLTEEQLKILHEIKHLIEIKDAGRNFTKKITEMDESIDIEKALFDEFGMKLE